MTVDYGSPAHLISILITLSFALGAYLALRRASERVQRLVILGMMLLNLAQHLLKSFIYPHHLGEGFTLVSTAYNMCAFLIIVSPLAMLLTRSGFFRDFIFLLGSAAGLVAVLVPYWHIGASPFTWEYFRYMLCHVLLYTTSILPLLLGLHKPSFRSIPFFGLAFLGTVAVILLNDTVCYYTGLYKGVEGMTLYEALLAANPVWAFRPPDGFSALFELAKAFLPDAWLGGGESGMIVPLVWYAIPLYFIITLISVPIVISIDKNNFKEYLLSTKRKRQ